jgi:hypothetical protein
MSSTTILLVFFPALLLLSGCVSERVESRISISGREEIIFESKVQYGRILRGNQSMSWEATPMNFILTPTTLYLVAVNAGYSINIPFRAINEIVVREVPYWTWWPFGKPEMIPDLLVIESDQINCWEGCVFRFQDPQSGHAAVTLVERQKALVDAFGRLDGPREFGLVTSSRVPDLGWRPRPFFLQSRHPEIITSLDDLLESLAPQLTSEFNNTLMQALDVALAFEPEPRWHFRTVTGATGEQFVYYETFPEITTALRSSDPDLNGLLYVRFGRISLTEKISAQYEPSVELNLGVDLYFRDLAPPSPGLETQVVFTSTHKPESWLDNAGRQFHGEIQALSREIAVKIADLLSANGAND